MLTRTCSTSTASSIGPLDIKVVSRIGVPFGAVGFTRKLMSSGSHLIHDVLASRAPFQVVMTIVRWVVVKMSRLMTIGARPSKGGQNQSVYREGFATPIAEQSKLPILTHVLPRLENPASRTHIPSSADAVVFPVRYREPHFWVKFTHPTIILGQVGII